MKFLKREYDDFKKLILENGLDPDHFHHIKKRGHLYVQQEGREDTFCFFRKKETTLNEQLQWEDKVTYFLDPKNTIQVDQWNEVLEAFKIWLLDHKK